MIIPESFFYDKVPYNKPPQILLTLFLEIKGLLRYKFLFFKLSDAASETSPRLNFRINNIIVKKLIELTFLGNARSLNVLLTFLKILYI